MTSPSSPLTVTSLPNLTRHRQGKVRDIYDVDGTLLMVATDRISAFDYVLGSPIPDKGRVLTQLSAFWFGRTTDIIDNHLITMRAEGYPAVLRGDVDQLRGRSMLVHRTDPIPIECVVRGYLSGSGWREYVATGSVCSIRLPPGLRESDRLPEPIFTPATKAESGHDVNISEEEAGRLAGSVLVSRLRELALALYAHGAAYAESRGIIVADTKFEFGRLGDRVMLIDEVLTPDSSRFWPQNSYRPGGPQPSFDKQYVRDYLETIGWNKQPPVPTLPADVIERTRAKYLEAFERLTGRELE